MNKMLSMLTILLIVTGATSAQATLKLQTQGNFYEKDLVKPQVGLSYYEKLWKFTAVNAYAGYGNIPEAELSDINWYVAKAQVDIYWGKFTIAPGYQYKAGHPGGDEVHHPYIRIDYKLLD